MVRFIDAHRDTYGVEPICAVLPIAPSLYHELRADDEAWRAEGIEGVFRIGDCVAPGFIADAVFAGHRLAREIDSENPALPLPVRRELPVADRAALGLR